MMEPTIDCRHVITPSRPSRARAAWSTAMGSAARSWTSQGQARPVRRVPHAALRAVFAAGQHGHGAAAATIDLQVAAPIPLDAP